MSDYPPNRPLGVGGSWGRTIVVRQSDTLTRAPGDRLVGMMDTRALGALVVEAVSRVRDEDPDYADRLSAAVAEHMRLFGEDAQSG